MLRLFQFTPLLKRSICQRSFTSTCLLSKQKKTEAESQQLEEAWAQADLDPTSIMNNVIPQPATKEVPTSLMAAFNNMFDRGPNVGIDVITKHGFVLTNQIRVTQPLILVNGSPFLWNAPKRSPGFMPMKDWDVEAFKIFELVSPKPELILFGTGREFSPVPEHVRQFFFKHGIQVDQMSTVSVI